MATTVEELYQIIADEVIKEVEDDWSEARVEVEMEDDNGTLEGTYQRSSDGEWISFDCSYEMYKAFREMRQAFADASKPPWSKAIFTLDEDGEFKIKFEYE